MTNYEKYKDEIISRIVDDFAMTKDGEITYCDETNCENCAFFSGVRPSRCIPKIEEWLNKEYQEPLYITKQEKAILDMLPDNARFKKMRKKDSIYSMLVIDDGSSIGCRLDLEMLAGDFFDWIPNDEKWHSMNSFRNVRVRE